MPTIRESSRSDECLSAVQLESIVEDRLSVEESSRLESHLSQCDVCRNELEQFASGDWERWAPIVRDAMRPSKTSPRGEGEWGDGPSLSSFKIEGYELLQEIGRGGMGVVFLANDTRLQRRVAVKVIRDGLLASPERIRRMQTEARSIAGLKHPGIVEIYATVMTDHGACLILEWVDGRNLAQILERDTPSFEQVAQLVLQLARTIQYAHANGVVHRDLKPANVLLPCEEGPSGELSFDWGAPKVVDFSLARWAAEEALTETCEIMGTPSYMAPEQIQGSTSERAAESVDIYALGALLYELLTGRPPFRAATKWETLEQTRTADPISPCTIDAAIPRQLETICLQCLQKSPERRYVTADELAADLQRYLDDDPISAKPLSIWESGKRLVRRYPRPAFAACLALTVLLSMMVAGGFYAANLREARTAAQNHAEDAERNLQRARQAVAHYLLQVRDHQRLRVADRSFIEESLQVYRTIVADDSDPELRYEYAKHCFEIAKIEFHEEPGAAERHFRECIQAIDGRAAAQDVANLSLLGSANLTLANLLVQQRDFDSASSCFAAAEAAYNQARAIEPENLQHVWHLGDLYQYQGAMFAARDMREEAVHAFEQAVECVDGLPEIPDYQWTRARAHNRYADQLTAQQALAEARREYQLAYSLAKQLVASDQVVWARYRSTLATAATKLARNLSGDGSSQEIEDLLCEAFDQRYQLWQEDPTRERYRNSLSELMSEIETIASGTLPPRLDQRIQEARKRMSLPEEILNMDERLIRSRASLGNATRLLSEYQFDEAIEWLNRTLLILKDQTWNSDADRRSAERAQVSAALALSRIQRDLGDDAAAVAAAETAMRHGRESDVHAPLQLALALAHQGRYRQALSRIELLGEYPARSQVDVALALLLCSDAAASDDARGDVSRLISRECAERSFELVAEASKHPDFDGRINHFLAQYYAVAAGVVDPIRTQHPMLELPSATQCRDRMLHQLEMRFRAISDRATRERYGRMLSQLRDFRPFLNQLEHLSAGQAVSK